MTCFPIASVAVLAVNLVLRVPDGRLPNMRVAVADGLGVLVPALEQSEELEGERTDHGNRGGQGDHETQSLESQLVHSE